MENFPKYMPEAEERKQWVKRVMMGNRSEIKLKTKHQMAENRFFSFTSRDVFCYAKKKNFSCAKRRDTKQCWM